MAFDNKEKVALMNARYKSAGNLANVYVALGIGTTELSGKNYSRGTIPASDITVHGTTGVVTIPANKTIYTTNANDAQDSTHMRLYSTSGGNDPITDWVSHNDIAAPANGQPVVTGTITLTP